MSKSRTAGILLICIAISGCSRRPTTPISQPAAPATDKNLYKSFVHDSVSYTDFKLVRLGMNAEEVTRILGDKGMHQFTYLHSDGPTYRMVHYTIDAGVYVSLLFENDHLVKLLRPPPIPVEEYTYGGSTLKRARPWALDDDTEILKSLSAPALTQEQVDREVGELAVRLAKAKRHEEPGNISPAFGLVGQQSLSKYVGQIAIDMQRNADLVDRLDGSRAKIGMAAADVDKIYGVPARIVNLAHGRTARLYGDQGEIDSLQVNPQILCSPNAVIFQDDRAIRILTYDFYDRHWSE